MSSPSYLKGFAISRTKLTRMCTNDNVKSTEGRLLMEMFIGSQVDRRKYRILSGKNDDVPNAKSELIIVIEENSDKEKLKNGLEEWKGKLVDHQLERRREFVLDGPGVWKRMSSGY